MTGAERRWSPLAIVLVSLAGVTALLVTAGGYVSLRPKPRPASLSGSVWLSDGAGKSDLQRGTLVYLVPGRIPPKDLRKLAGIKVAEIDRVAATASDNSGIGDDARALSAAAAAVSTDIGVDEALELLNRQPWGRYQKTTAADFWEVAASSAQTDVNGAYHFDGVAPGLYHLIAGPGRAQLEELVVVEKGQAAKQDLHN